jgi:hypothetical protein
MTAKKKPQTRTVIEPVPGMPQEEGWAQQMRVREEPIEDPEPINTDTAVYKPMAVPEPDPIERLAALELRMTAMEKAVSAHNRYHFGGLTG